MPLQLPPLSSLRVFEVIMRRGSIRQAADELCLTPQALSQRLKLLESHLGQPLFERGASHLVPTLAANVLIGHVREGLDAFQRGLGDIQRYSATQRLAVRASPYFATQYLAPSLGKLTASMPNIDFQMSVGIDLVEPDGKEIDATIIWGYGGNKKFIEVPLVDDLKVVVVAPSLMRKTPIVTVKDIQAHPVVLPSKAAWYLWAEALQLLDIQARADQKMVCMETNASTVEAVCAGAGVGLVSYAIAVAKIAEGALMAPFGLELLQQLPEAKTPRFSILYEERHAARSVVDAFTQWLLADVCSEAAMGFRSKCRHRRASP